MPAAVHAVGARRRLRAFRLLLAVLVVALSACASADEPAALPEARVSPDVAAPAALPDAGGAPPRSGPSDGDQPVGTDDGETTTEGSLEPAPSTSTPTPHPIAAADTELPPAPIGFEAIPVGTTDGPRPVSLAISDIGVDSADVIAVGVNEDLSFEVPPAEQVGWYKFGPSPGAAGSAVLAAHIAFDGVDGVFRHLADVEPGATVEVGFDDGTTQRYRITEVTDYLKQELPSSLWAEDGDPQLTLITCGGTFNPALSSYESNIVAIAVPI